MDDDFCRIDEGHVFSLEDEIFNIKWKVNELLGLGHSREYILSWRDDDIWAFYVKAILDNLSNDEKKRIH